MKKNVVGLIGILIVMSLTACGNKTEISEETTQNDVQTDMVYNAYKNKMTAEELLDAFIDGSVDAVDTADPSSAWNISDLNKDSQGEELYSIGERVDLDNDGENELVICGPYGGIYLDCRDDKVYEFARGDGSAIVLSYTYYNGDVWIMYSNDMNAGYETYHMEKYEGADNLAAEMNFGEELIDENDPDSGMKYFWNGKEVSNDEYDAVCSKIFAAQENTN